MNVIIHHERLSHDTARRSCVLLVEHSHFAFVYVHDPHSQLLSYIGDYLLQLHPLGAPLVNKISSLTSMNFSARLCRVQDLPSWLRVAPANS
jgi:hypothetical protein